MKTIHRTYRYAVLPNKEQEILLARHFGSVRWVYNYFLHERIEQYRLNGKSDHYHQQAAALVQLKKQEGTQWLREINSQSLQTALRHLDRAYVNFFRGRAKFPRFKSKKGKNSFTVPQFVALKGNRLFFPKFKGGLKLQLHRPLEGTIKHCTVSKTPTGKYFVSILCEAGYEPKKATGKCCGIDMGIKDFAVTSDGQRFANNRYLQQYERQLAKAQRHLSRKVKGSQNRDKQRLKVAWLHGKVANARLDCLHKISTQIANEYDVICLEDLNIKGMMANRKLARHIADTSWGTFVKLLEYKADWNNRRLVKINRFYPSSKTCYECGWMYQDLRLSDRVWVCANGHTLDRDINASKNILKEGLKILGAELSENTCGDPDKTLIKEHRSMKQEAHRSLAGG